MNSNVKYLGFLVIIPVLVILLIPENNDDLESEENFDTGVNQIGNETGDQSIINQTSVESENTIDEVKKICFSSKGPVPCDELDNILQEESMMEQEQSIEDYESKLAESNKFNEQGKSKYSSILGHYKVNVPATIPLHQGYYDGNAVYYIITDSSDETHADIISKNQGWQVELAPILANVSESSLSTTYMFTNGVPGDGVHGYQGEVFTNTPEQKDLYSALTSHVQITWNESAVPIILDSEKEIMIAKAQRLITFNELDVVTNMPQIVWPGGQMPVKANKTLTDDTPYVGGQVLDIDLEEKTVTFIAHKGWGPDGSIVYHIVTDVTPLGPSILIGTTYAPLNAKLIDSPAAVDVFAFLNGINGSGAFGFQAGVSSSVPGDSNYSPMCRIFTITWDDPNSASVLTVKKNIDYYEQQGKISINLARPMNEDHIVNCPTIDPFQ